MRRTPNRAGLASLIAIIMLGLLAVVIVVVAESFRVQVTRTRVERIDAQLRQMLLVGMDRVERLDAADMDRSKIRISVPGSTDSSISIELQSNGAMSGEAFMTATHEGRVATQHMQLAHVEGGWQITRINQVQFR